MPHKTRIIAAAVQAAPVYLDRKGSVEKACDLIAQASERRADLIALPEAFISGYPYWVWFRSIGEGVPLVVRLFETGVKVPGPETEALGEAARKAGAYVVIGVNEVDNKALYNTQLFFDRKGTLIGKHRKFKPTYAEKVIWADGDGSTHRVYETDFGGLGGLICAEHAMALPGFTLASMGEQVHVAIWVGFASCLGASRRAAFRNLTQSAAIYHAVAFQSFVINSQSVVDDYTLDILGRPQEMDPGGGWTAIIASGSGEILAGPLLDEEGIVSAEIDLSSAIPYYFNRDVTGQYRSPFFTVRFDPGPHPSVEFQETPPVSPVRPFPVPDEGGPSGGETGVEEKGRRDPFGAVEQGKGGDVRGERGGGS